MSNKPQLCPSKGLVLSHQQSKTRNIFYSLGLQLNIIFIVNQSSLLITFCINGSVVWSIKCLKMCSIKFLNLSQRRKESRKVHIIIFLTDIAMWVTISGIIIFASQFSFTLKKVFRVLMIWHLCSTHFNFSQKTAASVIWMLHLHIFLYC